MNGRITAYDYDNGCSIVRGRIGAPGDETPRYAQLRAESLSLSLTVVGPDVAKVIKALADIGLDVREFGR